MRRKKSIPIKKSIEIHFIVEGQTEKNYIYEFKKEHLCGFKIKIYNIENGNYLSFKKKFEEYKGTEIPVFAILDLDRATKDNKEKRYLKDLFQTLKHTNKESNIFLTYENFETFIKAHFKPIPKDLTNFLGFKDSSDIKNKNDIYKIIIKKGGKYENVQNNFSQNNICYKKINFQFPKFEESKIHLEQSSLTNLKDYCNYIKKQRGL